MYKRVFSIPATLEGSVRCHDIEGFSHVTKNLIKEIACPFFPWKFYSLIFYILAGGLQTTPVSHINRISEGFFHQSHDPSKCWEVCSAFQAYIFFSTLQHCSSKNIIKTVWAGPAHFDALRIKTLFLHNHKKSKLQLPYLTVHMSHMSHYNIHVGTTYDKA